jgi:hypothetical protein
MSQTTKCSDYEDESDSSIWVNSQYYNRPFHATLLSPMKWPPACAHDLVSKVVSKTVSQNLRLVTGNVRQKEEVAWLLE